MASKSPSAAKTTYLVLYNFVSAVLWATVLGRATLIAGIRSPALVHLGVDTFLRWTQTLAGVEVLHSLLGACPAPQTAEPSRQSRLSNSTRAQAWSALRPSLL